MLKKIHSAIYVICCLGSTLATDTSAVEKGFASYYADRFQGRKTASGQEYDRNKLTAAHKSLPIGSQIEVTNLTNHSSVIVTVNDRGPYSGKLSLDLSYAAAKEIGLLSSGVAPISINVLNAKNSDFENAIPAQELFEFNQLAKAEEVEEAEEEIPEDAVIEEPAVADKKTSHAKSLVKSAQSEKAVNAKTDNEHKDTAQSEKATKAKKDAESDNSKHKDAAKSDSTDHAKKSTKSDSSKDNVKSEKTAKAKKVADSEDGKHKDSAKSEKTPKAKKAVESDDSKHKSAAKSEKTEHTKKAAKSDDSKHTKSEKTVKAKKSKSEDSKDKDTKKAVKSKKKTEN